VTFTDYGAAIAPGPLRGREVTVSRM
jgi:hypothetical protein